MFPDRKEVLVLLVLFCVLLLLVGCKPDLPSYTLTIQVEGQGTVTPGEDSFTYDEGVWKQSEQQFD